MTTQPHDRSKPSDRSQPDEKTPPGIEAGSLHKWDRAFGKQGSDIATSSLLIASFTLIFESLQWFVRVAQGGTTPPWSLCASGASADAVSNIVGICLGGVVTLTIALLAAPALASISESRGVVDVPVNRVAIMKWMGAVGVAAGLLAATSNATTLIFMLGNLAADDIDGHCHGPGQVFPIMVLAIVTTLLSWYAIRPDLELAGLSASLRAAEVESARQRVQRIESRLRRGRVWRSVVLVAAVGAVLLPQVAASARWVSVGSFAERSLFLVGITGAWFLLCALLLVPVVIYRWNDLSHGGPGLTRRARNRVRAAAAGATVLLPVTAYGVSISVVHLVVLMATAVACALAVVLCTTDRFPRLGQGDWVGRWLVIRLNGQIAKLEGAATRPSPASATSDDHGGTGECP